MYFGKHEKSNDQRVTGVSSAASPAVEPGAQALAHGSNSETPPHDVALSPAPVVVLHSVQEQGISNKQDKVGNERSAFALSLAGSPVPSGGSSAPFAALTDARAQRVSEVTKTPHIVDEEEAATGIPHHLRHLTESELLLVQDVEKTRESFSSFATSFNYETDTPVEWETLSWARAASVLGTDVSKGLSNAEAATRLAKYGENALDKEKPTSIVVIFFMQFVNLIIFLLILASIAAFAIGHAPEGIAILVIITINAIVATIQERNAGNALSALAQLASQKCIILRDGVSEVVDAENLVPGDIVELTAGDVIPADLLLASSSDLKVNEMLLTGESEDVHKNAAVPSSHSSRKGGKNGDVPSNNHGEEKVKLTPANMCFSSTTVTEGKGRAIVVETGMRTRVGKIAALLKRERQEDESDEVSAEENLLDIHTDATEENTIKADFVEEVDNTQSGAKKSTATKKNKKKKKFCPKFKNPLAKHSPKETPLQRSLHKLGVLIGIGAIVICIVVFIVGVARNTIDPKNPDRSSALAMVMIAVSLAVSAIPEGLPMVVTICLTSGTMDMVKRNVVVRRLAAVETLGCASVVCTDKTGTLTQGKMTVVEIWNAFRSFQVTGKGFQPVGDILHGGVSQLFPSLTPSGSILKGLLSLTVLCSDTVIQEVEPEEGEDVETREKQWTYVGNSSEAPLIVCAAKAQIEPPLLQETFPRVAVVPFNSRRKLMLSVHSMKPLRKTSDNKKVASPVKPTLPLDYLSKSIPALAGAKYVAVIKGAPQVLVPQCSHVLSDSGEIVPFPQDGSNEWTKKSIDSYIDEMSGRALRVLAVTFRIYRGSDGERVDENQKSTVDQSLPWNDPLCKNSDDVVDRVVKEKGEGQLVLAGLFASIDPERDGVKEAVQVARDAGVRTIMITGDYLRTAIAIANNIALYPALPEGPDLAERKRKFAEESSFDCSCLRKLNAKGEDEYLSNEEIDTMTKRAVVFARAKPEDKLVIVQSLRRQGFVSAMTGDGVNDSPALKESDIGVAMGITGTEVAKGASDMILTDDNFVSIVAAIEKGRVIYANIKNFVFFLLSTNLGEVLLILTTIVVGMPIPFEPLQVLVLNLLSDGMPAVALSLEKGDNSAMKIPPRPKKEYIITGVRQWSSLGLVAIIIFLSTFIVYSIALYAATGELLQDTLLQEKDLTDVNEQFFCRRVVAFEGFKTVTNCDENALTEAERESTICLPIGGDNCVAQGIGMARTTAFISMTLAEMLRAYTVRFFTKPVWYRIGENKFLHLAAILSIILTVALVLIPGVRDIFNFELLPVWYWFLAIGGSLLTLTLTETLKAIYVCVPSRKSASSPSTV